MLGGNRGCWRLVLLCIDPGRRSGWSLWCLGGLVASGEVDVLDPAQVDGVVQEALLLARSMVLPAVLVVEQPAYRAVGNPGPSRPIWRSAWKRLGGVQKRHVPVSPSAWRSRVLGRGMGSASRAAARHDEQNLARHLTRRDVGADEAPAICIGLWARRSEATVAVLPSGIRTERVR